MITDLQLRNFKGFTSLKLDGLSRITLIIGGNNTGKTSILEALILLMGDGRSIRELPNSFRRTTALSSPSDELELYWRYLFRDRDPSNQMVLETTAGRAPRNYLWSSPATPKKGQMVELVRGPDFQLGGDVLAQIRQSSVDIPQTGHVVPIAHLSVRPTDPNTEAERFNEVVIAQGGETRIESLMKQVDSRLEKLRYARIPGTSSAQVFAHVGLPQAVPVSQLGQAFGRLLFIYSELLCKQTRIVLIDEVENGIFAESMEQIWRGLIDVAESEDVQIIATTHSRECVMAAVEAASDREGDPLCVQRLQLVDGQIEAVRLGGEHLKLAQELGLEVRS